MIKKKTNLIWTIAFSLFIGGIALAQEISNYLITSNIGDFIASANPTSGKGPGVVVGANHFYHDHADMTYRISYFNLQTKVGPEIQVTQHADSDSDKWLLHEVDREFRNYYGLPGKSYGPRQINGQTILENLVAGGNYRWLSGNKVVVIEYHDSQMNKPEPIEVIQAYLAKHPSTVPAMTLAQLRSAESKTTWIKDEMDRRLWLGDKWIAVIQPSDQKLRDKLKSMTDSMVVFLNYREKYFAVASKDEKIALETALSQNNAVAVQTKLAEYKTWWAAHNADSITLP